MRERACATQGESQQAQARPHPAMQASTCTRSPAQHERLPAAHPANVAQADDHLVWDAVGAPHPELDSLGGSKDRGVGRLRVEVEAAVVAHGCARRGGCGGKLAGAQVKA